MAGRLTPGRRPRTAQPKRHEGSRRTCADRSSSTALCDSLQGLSHGGLPLSHGSCWLRIHGHNVIAMDERRVPFRKFILLQECCTAILMAEQQQLLAIFTNGFSSTCNDWFGCRISPHQVEGDGHVMTQDSASSDISDSSTPASRTRVPL